MAFNVYDYDWQCDNCGAYLNSQPGFCSIGGFWQCEKCGFVNDVTINNTDDAPESDYDDDNATGNNDEIPEGCVACGGPYPFCTISCPVFDDDD